MSILSSNVNNRKTKKSLGIYIHIPFCIQKCLYCDFCSFPDKGRDTMELYTDELCRRIEKFSLRCADFRVDTLYLGGGTPTLLPLSCFQRLMDTLRRCYELSEDCEISCECNPATADRDALSCLRKLGINRLSIGLQSASDDELRLLGRAHSFSEFQQLLAHARAVGFDNISVDLMYGIPSQTLESFRQTLSALAELSPEHISAYGLKIEEDTPFARIRNSLSLPDEDTELEMYRLCTDFLRQHGYEKYEISNFAREGKESKHNLRYWLRKDYVGFGVAAHSCFEEVRFGNSRDLEAFLKGQDITEERTLLTPRDIFNETVMLSLRLTRGIDCAQFEERFGASIEELFPALPSFIQHGFLIRDRGRLFFSDEGFFVSNSVLSELLRFDPF